HRGAGSRHPEDGGGGSLLHRRADPGQRDQGGARERCPPATRRPHRALRYRGDPIRRGKGEGARAQRCGRAAGEELARLFVFNAIVHALQISLFMLWEVLWPLAFGFLLSAMIQTVVSKRAVAGALGKPDLKGFFLACGFGAASSSCSYAAVAVGRAIFRRGASFVNAIIFEFTAISHSFYMDLNALYVDLGLGFLIAGALAAWVPNTWWQAFFLTNHPTLNEFWSPLIGPVISMLSFVCSVGNVPLAVVLWNGGISFGGVISFLFADLIILPILNIYRKYYGGRTSLYLLAVSYVAMALAGFLVGGAFQLLGIAPVHHHVAVFETRPSWNYTSFLDIAFLLLM